jgi:hypothetical protein
MMKNGLQLSSNIAADSSSGLNASGNGSENSSGGLVAPDGAPMNSICSPANSGSFHRTSVI